MAYTSDRLVVCFVCAGNICRSPMAVALMTDIIRSDPTLNRRDIEICSAGTLMTKGNPAHPYAQKAMQELGLTLDGHRSAALSPDIVARADLIVAMHTYVEEDVIAMYPESSIKTCTLEIADPIGRPEDAYGGCAQKIS